LAAVTAHIKDTAMPPLIQADWAKIRRDYEHSTRPIPDICAEHGISTGTLRDRVRRWGWARRWLPIPAEGPPPLPPPVETATAHVWPPVSRMSGNERVETTVQPDTCTLFEETPTLTLPPSGGESAHGEASLHDVEPSPHIETSADDRPIGERLQGATAQVLPAIEATLAKLTAGPVRPREMELAARALGSLTRTLRELNGLLSQHQASAAAQRNHVDDDDDMPEDLDEFRFELARRIDAFVASRSGDEAAQEAKWNDAAADAAITHDRDGAKEHP
jgi:hypothetical protein